MKKIISHTNNSFKERVDNQNVFIQIKQNDNFNHRIDYSILKQFTFVPNLIFNNKQKICWEFIEGTSPEKLNKEQLEKLANIIKEIHNSNLKFPSFNLAARIKEYRKIIKEKQIIIPIMEKAYKKINLILSKMDKNIPIHSDIWSKNIIFDKNHNLFLIDWEYAHLGDLHFELAYIICSFRLNSEDEKFFLDKYKNYNEKYLENQKILVNYYTILWINSQKIKYFSDEEFIKNLEKLLQ
ncbi:MAG: phosphotransferase [Metamycoplasmataceae bacterium]